MLALRYLYEIINLLKKQYSDKEREDVDGYLRTNQIFHKIFLNNVHEQILQRSVGFFRYLVQREVVGEKEIEEFWNSVPISDQRGRGII